jgi:hypothetical protein
MVEIIGPGGRRAGARAFHLCMLFDQGKCAVNAGSHNGLRRRRTILKVDRLMPMPI